MKHICTALLLGAAAIGVAALVPAAANALSTHQMTVLLPNGGTEIIRYAGDVAPKVSFDPTPFAAAWAPFAGFDRMDHQMDAMWRQVGALNVKGSVPGGDALLNRLPPGTESYSVITESNGNNVCRRTTEVIRPQDGGKPKTVTHVSGNCGAARNNPGVQQGNGANLTQVRMLEPVAYR